MPKVVGIICEYNPFHKGHKYQLDQVRVKEPDATIVAIMSGNIVQRGEFAFFGKYDRAKIALECRATVIEGFNKEKVDACLPKHLNIGFNLTVILLAGAVPGRSCRHNRALCGANKDFVTKLLE